MKRREFVTAVGGAALAWPIAAPAQKVLPVVGVLNEGLAAPLPLTTAFMLGLNDGGLGQAGVKIEHRRAEGQYDRLPALAADLIDRGANIILAAYLVAARAAEAATHTVPIIFITGSDPVAGKIRAGAQLQDGQSPAA